MTHLRLKDLPARAIFEFVPGPSPTDPTSHLATVRLAFPGDSPSSGDPPKKGVMWSVYRGYRGDGGDGPFDNCEVYRVDLKYADPYDPYYERCRLHLAQPAPEPARPMVVYAKDPTQVTCIIPVGRAGQCTDAACVKHGMTVEVGASGKCYCCGRTLTRTA